MENITSQASSPVLDSNGSNAVHISPQPPNLIIVDTLGGRKIDIHHYTPDVNLSLLSDAEREHILAHKQHLNHEKQHLAMFLILIVVMIVAQILLVWWKAKHQKSYIHASMIAMYIMPTGISIYRHFWRFLAIWLIISIITIALVWRPLIVPNFSRSGSAIPRLLYRWFYVVYSISSVVTVTGYVIILITFFGINLVLGLEPQTTLNIGFMMLFYGIYYGVLCRDFTDFLVDRLAARIGYYNPSSALPSRQLKSTICAICGRGHGSRENSDVDGSSGVDPLLPMSDDDIDLNDDVGCGPKSEERIFTLSCGHKFHEYCIYGWCLVGKRQVCPFCREKVDLGKLFSSLPFQKPHYLYGNLLDFIRYLFAW